MKKKLICPFTKIEIPYLSSYIKVKPREYKVSRKELKYLVYLESFGDIIKKEVFTDFYENKNYSMPMFKQEFGIPYTTTQFLIKYHKCNKRTMKEATKIGATRTKQTNLERYGVDQTFKVPEFDAKRKESFIKRYGVDNPFKEGKCLENIEQIYQDKYGISLREKRSINSKRIWNEKTTEEKEEWINKTVCSDKSQKLSRKSLGKIKSGSSLEKRIGICLLDLGTSITTQFKIQRWSFDFYLPDYNILIEVNGDNIHANPEIFKETDILVPSKLAAKEIWERDKKKIDFAKNEGYSVIVIWQKEMKFLSNKDLLKLIYEKISNSSKNQENH